VRLPCRQPSSAFAAGVSVALLPPHAARMHALSDDDAPPTLSGRVSAAAAILAACGGSKATDTPAAKRRRLPAREPHRRVQPASAATSVPTAAPAAPQAAPTAAPTAAASSAVAGRRPPPSNRRNPARGAPEQGALPRSTGANSLEGPTLTIGKQIFDQLVARDAATGEFKPSLATKWATPDPQTWTFTLRTDAKFHDGSPVTSKDVKATLMRIMDKKGPIQPSGRRSTRSTRPTRRRRR